MTIMQSRLFFVTPRTCFLIYCKDIEKVHAFPCNNKNSMFNKFSPKRKKLLRYQKLFVSVSMYITRLGLLSISVDIMSRCIYVLLSCYVVSSFVWSVRSCSGSSRFNVS